MAPQIVQWKKYTGSKKDAYGKKIDTWGDPVLLPDASFAPNSSVEPRDGTTTNVVENCQLILSNPIDYDARDRFLVDGVEYQAEGIGGTWYGRFSGRLFGQVIEIKGYENG